MSYIIDDIRPTSWHLRVRDEATGTTQDLSFGPDHPWKIGPGSTGVTHGGTVHPPTSDALHPFHTFRVGASARLMTVKEIHAMARRAGGKKFAALAEGEARDREAIRLVADTLGGKYEGVGGGPPFADPKSNERWASRPLDANITLRLNKRGDGGVLVGAIGEGAIGWTEAKRTLLGAPWTRDERGAPVATLTDSPTLVAQIQAAHPGVQVLDPSEATNTDRLRKGAAIEAAEHPELPRAVTTRIAADHLRASPSHYDTPAEPAPAVAEPKAKPRAPSEPRKRKLRPGKGPGGLSWQRTEDDGNKGLVANWRSGKFKILRASPQTFALFYEYNVGGFHEIGCASEPEQLQAVASEWITKARPGIQVSGACASPAAPPPPTPAATSPASASPPSSSPPSPPSKARTSSPASRLQGIKPLAGKYKTILERVTQGLAEPGEEGSARKIKDPTGSDVFLPLSVERIGDDRFSLAHYFEQMGDLVPDPDIEFIREGGEWYPAAVSLAIGKYRVAIEETEDGELKIRRGEYSGLVELAKTMLKNIEQNLLRKPDAPATPTPTKSPAPAPAPATPTPTKSPVPAAAPKDDLEPDPEKDAVLTQLFEQVLGEEDAP